MIFKNRKEEYIFLFKKGLKDLDIAQILGVSESFVAKARNKYFKSGDSVCKKSSFSSDLVGESIAKASFDEENFNNLVLLATKKACELENAKNEAERLFYEIVCSFIDSHHRYKNLSLEAIKKEALILDLKISKLQIEISADKKKGPKNQESLERELADRIKEKEEIEKKLTTICLREDFDALVKLKSVLSSKNLKLE
ncbi:helix-turn-helix domain-containing protein [Borreliella americana]|uniref:helix-turn-helix domain-containing protein n=1 Tax=Borreliella americana TaxID=478807 RepID=UPI001E5100E7|nr:helix-turn-helix domain-containing protein [Borreliella americana]MCD2332396.1 helix-turn-helix domain-containing protein [Borreliella americana]MCD2349290.1 helix-turn-helix domain-containing protein [Borreliella americana]MCD2382176.1 helix-turn-helix domain-containing protein [Borreliella americana]